MANKSRGGLSQREFNAKQAGVKVDYSKSASQQGKGLKISIPKSVQKQSTSSKLQQAQKSQPMKSFQTLPNGQYGPVLPAGFKMNQNYATPADLQGLLKKPKITNFVGQSTGNIVKKLTTGALKPIPKPIPLKAPTPIPQLSRDVSNPFVDSILGKQNALKKQVLNTPVPTQKNTTTVPEGYTFNQKDNPSLRLPGSDVGAKALVRAPLQFGIKAVQSLAGGGSYTPTTRAEKFLAGKDPIGSYQSDQAKIEAYAKSKGISRGGAALAGVAGATAEIGLDFWTGGKGRIADQILKATTEAAARGVAEKAGIQATPEIISRIMKADTPNASSALANELRGLAGVKTAQASEIIPEAAPARLADNIPTAAVPKGATSEVRALNEVPKMPKVEVPGEVPKEIPPSVPRTPAQLPKGNHGRSNELYTEPDSSGKEKVFANIDDGSKEAKQVEIGSFDEQGNFIENMAEDGRPISTVLDESMKNLREGKKGLTKLDAPQGSVRVGRDGKLGGKGKLGGRLGAALKSNLAKRKATKLAEDLRTGKISQTEYDKAIETLRGFNSPAVGETVPTLRGQLETLKSPLLQEARKYKSAEEFVKAVKYRGEPTNYGKPFGTHIKETKTGVPRVLSGSGGVPTSRDFITARGFGNEVRAYVPKTDAKVLSNPDEIMKLAKVNSPHNFFFKANKVPSVDGVAFYERAKQAGYDAVDLTDIEKLYRAKPGGSIFLKGVEQETRIINRGAFTEIKNPPKSTKELTDLYHKATGGVKGLLPAAREAKGAQSSFNPESYVKEMAGKQKQAEGKTTGLLAKTKSFLSEFKRKIVEINAPIEDIIAGQKKKLNFESIPRYDMTDAIDRVYKSTSMAGNFAKENGLEGVIKSVDNLDELDQYLIAKHGQSLEREGITTGRDAVKDRMLIEAVGGKYAKEEKVVRDYSHKLLDYAVDSGLVSKKVAQDLKVKYPDYVPYSRIFGEEEAVAKGTGGGTASLGRQSVVQRIKGSEREVQSPMQSFLEKTSDAFHQGEKNKAAQILTSFHNLPDNPFGLEKIIGKSPGDNTISVFKDGVKETWKANKDVVGAAKALNAEQIGILGKIFVAPIRVAKLGITGINLPFVGANIVRDIVSSFVVSKNSFRSLLSMPEALFQAVGHGKLYKEMVGQGAMQTSFDIARNQVSPTIRNARGLLGNKGMERVKYIASTPAKLFRAVEDIIGRSEELNRIAQYKGGYQGAIKKGMTPIDARAVAARASRENSVNFSRRGEYGQAMNAIVLYLNAGIQGSRTLLRAVKTRPLATSAKIVTVVGMPVAITTSWNLSDPKRKAAYEDIPEFEKENNLIFIPNNPTQDENGKWNVVKVPIQPGLSNMVQPIRYALERASGLNPQTFAQMASQISGTFSPVQAPLDKETGRKAVSQLMPQAIKPTAEALTNTDFFTGGKIIPLGLQGLSPENQVKDNTSGTSKILGKQLGASPLQVEHFIKSTFGSVGLQFLNASDRALAKTGKISPDDIGGQEVMSAVTARFSKATGGVVENKVWEAEAAAKQAHADENYVVKQKVKETGEPQKSGDTWFYLDKGEIKNSQTDNFTVKPLYEQVQELKKSNPDEAQKVVDNLSEEDYTKYTKVRASERAKSSSEFHDLLSTDPKKAVEYVRSQTEEEAQRLVDNMTDAQYEIYDANR